LRGKKREKRKKETIPTHLIVCIAARKRKEGTKEELGGYRHPVLEGIKKRVNIIKKIRRAWIG